MSSRVELVSVADGIRDVVVARTRKARPPVPLARIRTGVDGDDPAVVLERLPSYQAEWARRIVKEGFGRWRRWDTLVRHAGEDFSPLSAERDVLPVLVRGGLVVVRERALATGGWRPQRFHTPEHVAEQLGAVRPEAIAATLLEELVDEDLRAEVAAGPQGLRWPAFAFVLRAAARYRDRERHGTRPRPRELAGQVDHTKAWSHARQQLLVRLLGRPWDELFPPTPRQIAVRGPFLNPQMSVWTEGVSDVPLTPTGGLIGIVCVENKETFEELWPFADEGWVVLHVPGFPPAAEIELLSRLHALAPGTPVYAAFDPDPAGIRIALILARSADVPLRADLMTPELLAATKPLDLEKWDVAEVRRQRARAAPFDALRDAIEAQGRKGEQETAQQWLAERLGRLGCALRA